MVEGGDILSHQPNVVDDQLEGHAKRDKEEDSYDYQDYTSWLLNVLTVVKTEIGIIKSIFCEILHQGVYCKADKKHNMRCKK